MLYIKNYDMATFFIFSSIDFPWTNIINPDRNSFVFEIKSAEKVGAKYKII